MRSRIIGGEFELTAVPKITSNGMDYYSYASGRAALYQILMDIKHTTVKVWLPDWLCESMIDAVKKAGLDYGFYKLGYDMCMDVRLFIAENRPINKNEAIVLVKYFGLIDIEKTISELRSFAVESVIIEDDVHALFSFLEEKGHKADYRFTSLRKTIASPDGGLVKTKNKMPLVRNVNTFADYKLKGALVKGRAVKYDDDNIYLSLFEQGESEIENNYDSMMSYEGVMIFFATNLQEVAEKRKRNAHYLIKKLRELGIESLLPIKDHDVPLFVPIAIEKRDLVRIELQKNGIFCPVHWPLREDMTQLTKGREMAEKELSLVIDQRYTEVDMDCIVRVLEDTI